MNPLNVTLALVVLTHLTLCFCWFKAGKQRCGTDEGIASFQGQSVMLFCSNYIYAGTVTEVTASHVKLANAQIVYETGAFTEAGYKDAQTLPTGTWFVTTQSIESFGPGK
jgi:hypothetical protein